MAARRLGEDSWNGLQPEPGRGSEHFGICGARIWALVRARDGWFPVGTVQSGASDHNLSPKMTVGSGCSRPRGWTPPTAKSPEEMARKCAAGRDAVQIAKRKEFVSKSCIPSNAPSQYHWDHLGVDGDGASPQH